VPESSTSGTPVTEPEVTSGDLPEGPVDQREKKEESFIRWLGELIVMVGLAFVLAMGIKTFVQPFVIPSGSMEPTLMIEDRVLVNKFLYRIGEPKQGDIVVFVSPSDKSIDYIKRVVAVGGQTVNVDDGRVSVDGKLLDEPYVNKEVVDHYSATGPVVVPAGQVFLMGDNRTNSRDSRYFGPRPVSELLGRAFAIYWPVGRLGTL
jgi:signal peptidase I